MNTIVENIADLLALPLWNIEEEKVSQVAQVYSESGDIAGLRVLDEEGNVLFEKKVLEAYSVLVNKKAIEYEGQQVGFIEVSVSEAGIHGIKRSILFTALILMVVVTLAVGIMIHILLQRYCLF